MKTRIAALQMVSAPELAVNLEAARRLIAAAAAAGARLVALPENFYLIGRHETDKVSLREPDGRGPIQDFLSRSAREHRVWIVAGTVPISGSDDEHIRGACLVYDDQGKRLTDTTLIGRCVQATRRMLTSPRICPRSCRRCSSQRIAPTTRG